MLDPSCINDLIMTGKNTSVSQLIAYFSLSMNTVAFPFNPMCGSKILEIQTKNFKILAIFTIYVCNKLGNNILSLKKIKRLVDLVGLVPFLN